MESTLIDKGITLMLAGMGTVFAFLTVLVIATSIMSAFLKNWGPAADAAGGDTVDEETVAAISAAITKHRQR